MSDVTNQSEKLRKRQTIGFEEEEDEDDGKWREWIVEKIYQGVGGLTGKLEKAEKRKVWTT